MIIVQQLLGMAVLLILSGFFSASETALFSLTRRDLRQLESRTGLLHGLILRLRSDPQGLLSTVLFGNMLVNVLYYCLATVAAVAAAKAGMQGIAVSLGLGSLALLILGGEVIPKAVAVAIPLRFSRLAAAPLFFFHRALHPIRVALRLVTRLSGAIARGGGETAYVTTTELQLLIHATGERGVIAATERDMMDEIIEFAEIRVREVMVPRVDVVAFEVNGNLAEFRQLVEDTGITKVPVYEENIDNVIGIVYAWDVLLAGSAGLRQALRPIPLFVPETGRIEAVLHQFRQRQCQFALVVDEYGGWAGVVTLEDIIEEIVGDISDEFDTEAEPVQQLGPDRYLLSGGVGIRDWSELFNIDVDLAEVETLGGFIMLRLGRLPRQGDTVRLGNLVFTVQTLARHRIAEVLVERANGTDAGVKPATAKEEPR